MVALASNAVGYALVGAGISALVFVDRLSKGHFTTVVILKLGIYKQEIFIEGDAQLWCRANPFTDAREDNRSELREGRDASARIRDHG